MADSQESNRRWILGPVTTGDSLSYNDTHRHNGRISAILVMCLVISTGVVLHVSYLLPLPHAEDDFQKNIRAVLIFYKLTCVASSLIIMLSYFVRANTWKDSGVLHWALEDTSTQPAADGASTVQQESQHRTHHYRYDLELIGVFIFGSGKIVHTLLHALETTYCLQLKTYHRSHIDQLCEYLLLIYFIVIILFTAIQMGFLRKFRLASFQDSCWFQYTLIVIFFVNILHWLTDFIDDFDETMTESAVNASMFILSRNISEYDEDCLLHKTWFGKSVREAAPYMVPFNLEFSLMSAGLIYNICKSMHRHHRRAGRDGEYRSEDCSPLLADGDAGLERQSAEQQAEQPETAQIDRRRTWSYVRETQSPPRIRHAPHFGVGLVTGITSVIILLVLCWILADPDHNVRDGSIYAYNVYRSVHSLVLLLCTWAGFKAVRDHEYSNRSDQPNEILLIISVTGLFLFHFLHFIAAAGSPGSVDGKYPPGMSVIVCVFAAFNIMAAFTQATFLLTAVKYHPSPESPRRLMREIMAFIVVSNLGLWVLDSFFQVNPQIDTDPMESWFYGSALWYIVSHFTLPLDTFFRFHSFVFAYEIYDTFKYHDDPGHGSINS